MSFKKYKQNKINDSTRVEQISEFKKQIKSRRSVRDFSKKDVSQEIIENIISIAASAPSGANKEPWFFSIVKDIR